MIDFFIHLWILVSRKVTKDFVEDVNTGKLPLKMMSLFFVMLGTLLIFLILRFSMSAILTVICATGAGMTLIWAINFLGGSRETDQEMKLWTTWMLNLMLVTGLLALGMGFPHTKTEFYQVALVTVSTIISQYSRPILVFCQRYFDFL